MSQKDYLVILGTAILCLFIASQFLPEKAPKPPRPEIEQPIPPEVVPPDKPSPPVLLVPEFVDVPEVSQHIREDSLYADIMNRQSRPFTTHDRDTNAHETSHGIHSDLRNRYSRQLGKKVNGFYVTGGKGVIIEEPGIRKSAVKPYLPQELRSYRYSTYISGQGAWDDVPLYLVDEWVAYVNGASVSVQDVQEGRHNGEWTDAVSGCLDFSIYCVALAMAVERGDPGYWESNVQFRRFMDWHLRKAHRVFMSGRNMEQFRWDKQEKLLTSLRNSENGKPMREFLNRYFGGIWLNDTPATVSDLPDRAGNRNLGNRCIGHNHGIRVNFGEAKSEDE